jgi:amino acid transporter
MPPLEDVINSPGGQALPYIFHIVMGSPGGGLGLTFLVLMVTMFCSISITVAASRCTWAFARDDAIPLARLWAKVDTRLGVPAWSLVLVTVVQMLLGIIILGSSTAFLAFVSVGVQALALSYAIPIAISLWYGRREVMQARWNCGKIVGPIVNSVALCWIGFEMVLFSMPTALPVTDVTMNYASVVLVGFGAIAAVWYAVHSRKCEWFSFPAEFMV